MAVLAYRQWRANEIAMRHARPLPPSVASVVVAVWVALVAVVMAATVAALNACATRGFRASGPPWPGDGPRSACWRKNALLLIPRGARG